QSGGVRQGTGMIAGPLTQNGGRTSVRLLARPIDVYLSAMIASTSISVPDDDVFLVPSTLARIVWLPCARVGLDQTIWASCVLVANRSTVCAAPPSIEMLILPRLAPFVATRAKLPP